MRFLILSLTIFSLVVFAKTDIDKKINSTNSKLSSYNKNYSKLNKKMAQTAKAILVQKDKINKQNIYLKKLQKELSTKSKTYKENIAKLEKLKKSQDVLIQKQTKIEDELIKVVTQSVSLGVIVSESSIESEESLIELEVLKSMLNNSKRKADELGKIFFATKKDIDSLDTKAKRLEVSITNIDKKKKELIRKKEENKKALKKLTKAKASYKKELKNIIKRQNELKNTLSKLNIVKVDEKRKAQEEKEQKEAFSKQKIDLDENLPKVKKHGNSYQKVKTKRYRGPKTIAPLSSYTITKKYGTYTDPIYGIKIFNESISLKPKKENAKVKTVFNGKVIYADKTAVLNYIVIVEHKNGLHTIYANLSQIAPNISKGKKVKRGKIIGRVKDELVFEVTQKSYHINPIRLFK
jgi:septal ring factor EnvC (AmiA/AmiB activator)